MGSAQLTSTQHEAAYCSGPCGHCGCRSLLLRRLRPWIRWSVRRLRTWIRPQSLLRQAEAEAEPKAAAEPYYYGGYRLGYGGLYGGYGLGYGHRVYYGKREAEAEPKAAAEPYYYGGYRLGYGGLYGGYGLGYGHGVVYGKR